MPRSIIIVYGSSTCSLLRNFPTVPHSGCINLCPHQKCRRALFFPHFLQHLLSVKILMVAILTSVRTHLIVVLICISLIVSNADHIFKCLLAICMFSLEKHLFRSSSHFFDWVVCFLTGAI